MDFTNQEENEEVKGGGETPEAPAEQAAEPTEATPEAPAEAPVEAPVETPAEAPAEGGEKAPAEETPAE